MEAVHSKRTKKIKRSKHFSSPLVETLSRCLQQSREMLTVGLRHHLMTLDLAIGGNHNFVKLMPSRRFFSVSDRMLDPHKDGEEWLFRKLKITQDKL